MRKNNEYSLEDLASMISNDASLDDLAQLIGDLGLEVTDIEAPAQKSFPFIPAAA